MIVNIRMIGSNLHYDYEIIQEYFETIFVFILPIKVVSTYFNSSLKCHGKEESLISDFYAVYGQPTLL